MEMVLRRIAKKQDYTIGWLYLNRGEKKFCDTLEPPALEKKTSVAKEVVLRSKKKAQALKPFAIPEGRYAVVITFSPKKKKWLPLLLGLKVGMVLNSNAWVERLKKKIVEAKDRGEGVWITVE